METNTKILLAILIVITLPITIPLLIIVIGMAFGMLCLILGLFSMYPIQSILTIGIIVATYLWFKHLQSR